MTEKETFKERTVSQGTTSPSSNFGDTSAEDF